MWRPIQSDTPSVIVVSVLVQNTAPGRGLGTMVWPHVGMEIKAASIQPNDRKRGFISHQLPVATPLRARMFGPCRFLTQQHPAIWAAR